MIVTISQVNVVVTVLLVFVLTGCSLRENVSPLLASEPAADSITDRIPRTLRLYFKSLPNVELSNLRLSGPGGGYTLRGLHTMGEDDLMVEIYRPMLVDGEYRVEWEVEFNDGRASASGEYDFSVKETK
ncbi:copper resistance protein CopC [Gammaproteobacteria bacterium]|nr:copper resistance protein CopC [Gammaproteobacteria bacterium]MDB2444081.1 copper resistance protein CopC [Gammaproteobacteria bacterium]MDG1951819.1 copper resistance protein CopC [Gammaproteobacteria bacterium]